MRRPPVRLVRANDTSRLVPSKHAEETVLAKIAEDDAHLQDLFALDQATNDRLLAENDRAAGMPGHELVFGVPWFRIVSAAFSHAHPSGGRFNGPDRGAWYAGFELETAQAEVAHHKWLELSEVGWLEEEASYVEYRADFSAEFHDLRGRREFRACLDPASYVASQRLAADLLAAGFARRRLPERAPAEGDVRRVLPSRARRQRPAGGALPVPLVRLAGAGDRKDPVTEIFRSRLALV